MFYNVSNICQDATKRTARPARDERSATNLARALSRDFYGKFVVQDPLGHAVSVWSDGRNVSNHYTGSLPKTKWLACAEQALSA